MWRDAWLVASRDLRIELRSRVVVNQVAPFAVLVLVLFAFALDPDRGLLERATAGLFWVTVLLSLLLAVHRSVTVDSAGGVVDALRLSQLHPGGMFLGKCLSVGLQLLVLQALLGVGVVVLYGTELRGAGLLVAVCLAATTGLAAAGTLYGVLATGSNQRETLLPLLLLPVAAPVLIGATRASEEALAGTPGEGWSWVGLLAVFAAVYIVFGILAYGFLLEDS